MPPEVSLSHHGVEVFPLVAVRLLVVAEVEEARLVEDVDHFADEVGADLVVGRRGDHVAVVLEPRVVRRGEVELRDRFEAHLAQARELGAETVDLPRALDGDFGVARVLERLAEVDDDEVHAGLDHVRGEAPPHAFVEAEVVLLADELEVLALVRSPGIDGLVAPHVHAHVEERAPDFSGRRRREGARRETGCGCGRSGCEEVTTGELYVHLILLVGARKSLVKRRSRVKHPKLKSASPLVAVWVALVWCDRIW